MICTCLTLFVAYNKCYALAKTVFIVTYAGMFMFLYGASISHPRRITVITKTNNINL